MFLYVMFLYVIAKSLGLYGDDSLADLYNAVCNSIQMSP